MAHLDINFDKVPDKFESLPPGIYELKVLSISEPEKTKKAIEEGTEDMKVVVELEVVNNPEFNDRKQTCHIGLKKPILLQQLIKSCGLKWGAAGGDTQELVGRIAKAQIKGRIYKDDDGVSQTASDLKAFLF